MSNRLSFWVLPVGSVEQHGPHLPLGVDTMVAAGFALRIAARHNALVAPAVPFGVLHKFRDWPGSLGVAPRVLADLVRDLIVQGSGASRRWLLLSGHDENHEALVEAARASNDACGADVVVVEWAGVAAPALARLSTSPSEMHGGEVLTSLLLHWHPESVRADRATDGGERVGGLLADDLHVESRAFRAVQYPPADGSSGVFGFPTMASAAKGAAVEEAVLTALDELVAEIGWAVAPPAGT